MRPAVQVLDRKGGTIVRAGGDGRGEGEARLPGGRSYGGKCRPADDGGLDARAFQCPQDLGGALVEQGDQQVLRGWALAQAVRERPGGTLSLQVEVGGAAFQGAAGRRDDRAQRGSLAGAQCRGAGPVSLGDSDEHVHRAARTAEPASELEATPYRLQVRVG
jgi:hypothetical protein